MTEVTKMLGGLLFKKDAKQGALQMAQGRAQRRESEESQKLTGEAEASRLRSARGGRQRALAYNGAKPTALGGG